MTKLKYYLKEMRVHHYIKNLLIVVPLACSGSLFDRQRLLSAIFGFLAFSFISSTVYIINDIKDVDVDRKNPVKCKRPIASSAISVKSAIILAVLLFILANIANFMCFSAISTLILLSYFAINLGYCFGLKNIPLLDIAILVSGFVLRALYGSFITGIQISNWLYLVIISAAFYLGFGKRRNELLKRESGKEVRKVMDFYNLGFLDKNMYVCMALVFVFYSLWSVDEKTIEVYKGNQLIWTVPVIMLIFMKYSMTVEKNSDGDPVEVLLHDKALIVICSLYLLLMFVLLYV